MERATVERNACGMALSLSDPSVHRGSAARRSPARGDTACKKTAIGTFSLQQRFVFEEDFLG